MRRGSDPATTEIARFSQLVDPRPRRPKRLSSHPGCSITVIILFEVRLDARVPLRDAFNLSALPETSPLGRLSDQARMTHARAGGRGRGGAHAAGTTGRCKGRLMRGRWHAAHHVSLRAARAATTLLARQTSVDRGARALCKKKVLHGGGRAACRRYLHGGGGRTRPACLCVECQSENKSDKRALCAAVFACTSLYRAQKVATVSRV